MWPNPQFPADLVTATKKSLMENSVFMCNEQCWINTDGDKESSENNSDDVNIIKHSYNYYRGFK